MSIQEHGRDDGRGWPSEGRIVTRPSCASKRAIPCLFVVLNPPTLRQNGKDKNDGRSTQRSFDPYVEE